LQGASQGSSRRWGDIHLQEIDRHRHKIRPTESGKNTVSAGGGGGRGGTVGGKRMFEGKSAHGAFFWGGGANGPFGGEGRLGLTISFAVSQGKDLRWCRRKEDLSLCQHREKKGSQIRRLQGEGDFVRGRPTSSSANEGGDRLSHIGGKREGKKDQAFPEKSLYLKQQTDDPSKKELSAGREKEKKPDSRTKVPVCTLTSVRKGGGRQ